MNDLQDEKHCASGNEWPDTDEGDEETGALLAAADSMLARMWAEQTRKRNGRPGEGRWVEGKE